MDDMPQIGSERAGRPHVAIIPWGDVIEDFLDGIGVTLHQFAKEMTGGWLFGYVDALKRAGVDSALICVSRSVTEPTRLVHEPTGTPLWALPAPRRLLALRRLAPSAGTAPAGDSRPAGGIRRPVQAVLEDVTPYAALPLRATAGVLRRERCTAILCQEYEYARFDLLALIARRLDLPLFATFQGGDWQDSRLERFVRPRTLRAASGVICAAQTEAARLAKIYQLGPEKVHAIPNPLDLSEWRLPDSTVARLALDIPAGATVIGWHGRISMHAKGLDVLLAAWRTLRERRSEDDLRLLLVGTGASREELRQRIEEQAPAGIVWIDEYVLDRDRLRGYLAAADVYVFPSRHEGSPVALMEAMACGFPVVAAAAPGVPDILGPGPAGVLVPGEDPEALATALAALIDSPQERARLAHAARQRAEEVFSLESVGRDLRRVIERAPRA